MKIREYFTARRVTGLALLLAAVIVLQIFGGMIKIGTTPLSFVLVPIVLGGALFGPFAGAFLGFAFGLIVWIHGLTGADPFTAALLADHFLLTTLLCIGKGVAAGLIPALIYKALAKKRRYAGIFLASAAAPVVNTSIFVVLALLMSDTLKKGFMQDGQSVLYFLVIVCAGINFLVEFAIDLICAPALYTVVRAVEKKGGRS